jgi:hypothetical protein
MIEATSHCGAIRIEVEAAMLDECPATPDEP